MSSTKPVRLGDSDYARLRRLQLAALEATGLNVSLKELLHRGIDLLEEQRAEESQVS